jgi:uncharacterized protein YcsI (UPF0317 family)
MLSEKIRLACRENRITGFPSLQAPGYLCVNIVMMDKAYAEEFELFCKANPVPCPLLGKLEAGQRSHDAIASKLDICHDLRSYDLYQNGKHIETLTQVEAHFTDDTVTFLIGSSVSFDGLLQSKGYTASYGPCIYLSSKQCETIGPYAGQIAVTMRSYPPAIADKVVEYTAHFPQCHGGPVGRNNPQALGIEDEQEQLLPFPGWVPEGHDKLYWGCGVTPSIVAQNAKLPLMIVHTPGNAMVTDIRTESLYDQLPQ